MNYGVAVLVDPDPRQAREMLKSCDVTPATMGIFYMRDILRRLLEGGAVNLDYVRQELDRRAPIQDGAFRLAVVSLARSGLISMVREVSPVFPEEITLWQKSAEAERQGLPLVAAAMWRISAEGASDS